MTHDAKGQSVAGAPKKGVVFTHFQARGSAFDPYQLDTIKQKWKQLFEKYAECSSIERIFPFIDTGYRSLMQVRTSEAPWKGLSEDRRWICVARAAAEESGCADKVFPIGFDLLVDVLSALQRRAGEQKADIRLLLLGSGMKMAYDSPKIVDAILRIAGRFTGSPVFRVDEDVEPDNVAFQKLLDAYALMPNPNAIFAYSGGYGGWDFTRGDERQQALLNNYAVRTAHLAKCDSSGRWQVAPDDCKKFLDGISDMGVQQAFENAQSGGNNRHAQVISGAGFVLSAEAIRKLPPFANLDNMIVWIDDHLKRTMHEALDDLGRNAEILRIEGALFKQNRHPVGLSDRDMTYEEEELGKPSVCEYLRRLARGCIFQALFKVGTNAGPYTQRISDYFRATSSLPPIFHERRGDDGLRPPGRKLARFGRELVDVGNRRVEVVADNWKDALSASTDLPKSKGRSTAKDFVQNWLNTAKVDTTGMIQNAEQTLVYQVVEDAEQYLELLKIWPSFVSLLEGVADGSDWLFDRLAKAR